MMQKVRIIRCDDDIYVVSFDWDRKAKLEKFEIYRQKAERIKSKLNDLLSQDISVNNNNYPKLTQSEIGAIDAYKMTDKEFMDSCRAAYQDRDGKLIEIDDWSMVDYRDIDMSDLPESREQRNAWYPDFEENGQPYIKIDTDWSFKVMAPCTIRETHMDNLEIKLDEELAKESPDFLLCARLNRELDKYRLKHIDDNSLKEWYDLALVNLDKRVAEGKPDKPVIREKLTAKIASL